MLVYIHVKALSDVALSFLLTCFYLLHCFVSLVSLILCVAKLPTQVRAAEYDKLAKALQKGARGCDNPACQTSRPDDKSNKRPKRPKKCAACEVALYCCAACQTAHWPAHAILCKELR